MKQGVRVTALFLVYKEKHKRGLELTLIIDTFKKVIDKYTAISIKKDILINEFKYNEKQISLLVSFGFLLPHPKIIDLFWFSIRGQGKFMSNLLNGRTETLRIIKKRNTKDIMEKV